MKQNLEKVRCPMCQRDAGLFAIVKPQNDELISIECVQCDFKLEPEEKTND